MATNASNAAPAPASAAIGKADGSVSLAVAVSLEDIAPYIASSDACALCSSDAMPAHAAKMQSSALACFFMRLLALLAVRSAAVLPHCVGESSRLHNVCSSPKTCGMSAVG